MNTSNILAEFTKTLEKEGLRIVSFITKVKGNEIEFKVKGQTNVIENGRNIKKTQN